jgi:hypothetical protein
MTTCASCGTRGWSTCITSDPILRELATDLPKFSIEQHGVCKGCTLGKHAKATFPSYDHRSKGILNLVPSDVCGLMSIASSIESM